jgi:hypothetical protein
MDLKWMASSKWVLSFTVGVLAHPGAGDGEHVSSPRQPGCLWPLSHTWGTSRCGRPTARCCENYNAVVGGNQSSCLCHAITASPNFTRLVGAVDLGRVYSLPFLWYLSVVTVSKYCNCSLQFFPGVPFSLLFVRGCTVAAKGQPLTPWLFFSESSASPYWTYFKPIAHAPCR